MRQSIAKRLTFWNIFWFWMAITFAVSILNALVIRDPWLLSSLVRSGVGFTLLICPRYPEAFSRRWGAEKSRLIIRLAALGEILISFCVRIQY